MLSLTEWSRAESRKRIPLAHKPLRIRRAPVKGVKVGGGWAALARLADARATVQDGVEGSVVDAGAQCAVVGHDALFVRRGWFGDWWWDWLCGREQGVSFICVIVVVIAVVKEV